VGVSLEALAQQLGVPDPSVLGAVFGHWTDLVGEGVAAHAEPVSLRDGVLVVAVDQPAWATELRYLGADLRRRVSEVAGTATVRSIRIRVSPHWPPR
jgi:predicted nucleic acid-binding Zn ribbon protein